MRRQVFLPSIPNHPYFIFPEGVGWYQGDPHHYLVRQKDELPYFNLHIILSGKGYLKTQDNLYTLQTGDSFLYFPSEEQTYYSDEEHPWEIMWVHFHGHYIKDYLIERGIHLSKVWSLKLHDNMRCLFTQLLEEAEEYGILHPSTLSSLTYSIITDFISQSELLTPTKGDIYHRIVALLPKMKSSCHKPFHLQSWADELGISNYYFCRMFKKVASLSPSEFITLCRLQKSKQLLIESKELTIKQIAIECGYQNISYFGKVFLMNEGVTPGEYRRRNY